MCRAEKKNSTFNRTLAPFALTFSANSTCQKLTDAPVKNPAEIKSFLDISDGAIVGKHL